jgi:hypothetical protein
MPSRSGAGSNSGPMRGARRRLPVSGLAIEIRQPTGREELLLLETPGAGAELALALAQRLGHAADGGPIAWDDLPVSDLDAFWLYARQLLIGDRLIADVRCRVPECGARAEISFSIGAYLDHHRPRRQVTPLRGWLLASAGEPGWFRLTAKAKPRQADAPELHFRLPTIADELAAGSAPNAVLELARRCIRPQDLAPQLRRTVETAMASLAPPLADELEGLCPDCGATVAIFFDPRQFCLQEMRNQAAFVYEDVGLLAQLYRWSEHAILAMPNARRINYAELARQSRYG